MTQRTFEPQGSGRVPGVVVIHEWWGVNDQIQSVAQRWASEGFVAVTPDLFDGKVAKTADEAQQMMSKLDFAKAVMQIGAAVEELRTHPRCNGKVVVTGYCMGGALTLASACNIKNLSAVVPYYGVPPGGDWSKVTAPVQAHFAETDEWATVAKAKQIQSAIGKDKMELHAYPAQHAFANDKRPEVYDASCTKQAWERSVAFVRQHTK